MVDALLCFNSGSHICLGNDAEEAETVATEAEEAEELTKLPTYLTHSLAAQTVDVEPVAVMRGNLI